METASAARKYGNDSPSGQRISRPVCGTVRPGRLEWMQLVAVRPEYRPFRAFPRFCARKYRPFRLLVHEYGCMAALRARLPQGFRKAASDKTASRKTDSRKTTSRVSKRLIVFTIAVLLGRRDIAVFDVIVRQGWRLWLGRFAVDLARRFLLLARSAHVVLVGLLASSDQNGAPAFGMKVRPGSG